MCPAVLTCMPPPCVAEPLSAPPAGTPPAPYPYPLLCCGSRHLPSRRAIKLGAGPSSTSKLGSKFCCIESGSQPALQHAGAAHLSRKGLSMAAGCVHLVQRKGVRDGLLGGGHLPGRWDGGTEVLHTTRRYRLTRCSTARPQDTSRECQAPACTCGQHASVWLRSSRPRRRSQ